MPYQISKTIEFDAGHRVPLHDSKCRNPHGHRYRVELIVSAWELYEAGAETGMVKDFGFLKQLLTEHVHDVYDHGFIVQDNDPLGDMLDGQGWKVLHVPWVPTAECLARSIHDTVAAPIDRAGCKLVRVNVWETPTSVASYGD